MVANVPAANDTLSDRQPGSCEPRQLALMPRLLGANVVTGKWLYKHKYQSHGSLAQHKARWVDRGFSEQAGGDYDA